MEPEVDSIRMELSEVEPKMRSVAVVMGTTTWSSWFEPVVEEESPTELRTPMTVRGTPSTLMVWPTGSDSLNSSDAVVRPEHGDGGVRR